VGDDELGKAGDLLRRLLAAGLSRHEPDELAALRKGELVTLASGLGWLGRCWSPKEAH
jgi:hypothetical protein